jgi:cell division transport system permease protein
MKSIKNHIMFILPLLAILLGIESFMVFGRVTASYGENLKEAYTILVVTKKPMELKEFKTINQHISRVEAVEKEAIVTQIAQGMSNASTKDIVKALPYFYTLRLDRYLANADIDKIKKRLIQHTNIRRVETFGQAHNANYNLYMLIRASLWTFVGFMVFTSLFLVLKQMEIWQLEHRERMQVMEILGASNMLRSGVLFRIALTDAVIAALVTIGIFAFLRYAWVARSEIDLLVRKQDLFFKYIDIAILGGIALMIVLVSVVVVARGVKETRAA